MSVVLWFSVRVHPLPTTPWTNTGAGEGQGSSQDVSAFHEHGVWCQELRRVVRVAGRELRGWGQVLLEGVQEGFHMRTLVFGFMEVPHSCLFVCAGDFGGFNF